MKRGFTIIELLATILILGVIAGITTTSVIKVINSNKEKLYQMELDSIKESAGLYYMDHVGQLPSAGNKICISTDFLKEKGYMENIIDPRTDEIMNEMKITIVNNYNKYTYIVGEECS